MTVSVDTRSKRRRGKSPQQMDSRALLANISARNVRRGLRIHPAGIQHMVDWMFEAVPPGGRALFVGVGHGHDALVALLGAHVKSVVGVDPYIETDGNGPEDYHQLLDLIGAIGVQDRFTVHRQTIQHFLGTSSDRFDIVVCSDVLHHMFVEKVPLPSSPSAPYIAQLFDQLGALVPKGGHLVITEISPIGFRPLLSRLGLVRNDVTYDTKHSWKDWNSSIPKETWSLQAVASYVPYALRHWARLLRGPVGRTTVSDRYRSTYQRK